MSFTVKLRTFAAIVLVGVSHGAMSVWAQQSETEMSAFVASKPEALRPAFEILIAGGARDSVLNNMEIATLALRIEDEREAADAIDRALLDIVRYYGQTEAAQKARSLWYQEGAKEFKGEPYERAMAHYYRGMLDLKSGDYGNAQASFISGFLQDAFSEEEQHTSDFSLLLFLNAWSLRCNDSDVLADDRFWEVEQLLSDTIRPPIEHDTLVVVETGTSPRKLADGIGHSKLVYRRGKKFQEHGATISLQSSHPMYPIEDIFYQASTRGSRPVDSILDGKIEFRQNNERAGDDITGIGDALGATSFIAGSSDLGYASSVVSLIGGLQLHRASNAKPRADTRYWSGLPDRVHLFTYDSLVEGTADAKIQYLNKNGEPISGANISAGRHEDAGKCGLIWVVSPS